MLILAIAGAKADFTFGEPVNLEDFAKLGQYWGQNESSVDIGPMAWGDGVVDIQDFAIFADHWLEGTAD